MRLVLVATLLTVVGCIPDQAPLEPETSLLTDPDAVLDSLVARWQADTEGLTGFTLGTSVVVAQYARQPDGAFSLADVQVRDPQAEPPPVQFLLPEHRRVADLLRGQSTLAVDRSSAPPRYRLVADSAALAAVDPGATAGPYAAPVAADAVIEAGTYRLREIRTRSPLPGSTVDSALVDLRIAYGNYEVVDGVPLPRVVTVTASGLRDTFDAGELMFLRAQYQQRRSQLQGSTGEARVAEAAALEDLRALIEEGVSTQTMRVDSVAVAKEAG